MKRVLGSRPQAIRPSSSRLGAAARKAWFRSEARRPPRRLRPDGLSAPPSDEEGVGLQAAGDPPEQLETGCVGEEGVVPIGGPEAAAAPPARWLERTALR